MKSKPYFTQAEADAIVRLIKEKLAADPSKQKSIRDKIRKLGFYASDYGFRDGYTVQQFLSVAKIIGKANAPSSAILQENKVLATIIPSPLAKSKSQSDERYIIDLCDEVLKLKALRQYRFDFLRGDSGTKLPVDAYYPALSLVIEYRERQHTEEVKFFDRRQTVSGVGRGEQRRIYDQKRRDLLPQNGISLVEFDYSEFEHSRSKKLLRIKEKDLRIIISKLNNR